MRKIISHPYKNYELTKQTPNSQKVIIGLASDILIRELNSVIPETEKQFFGGLVSPLEVMPFISDFAKKFNLDFDVALRGAILLWQIQFNFVKDEFYPINRFIFEQFIEGMNDQEHYFATYILDKIKGSRFSHIDWAPKINDHGAILGEIFNDFSRNWN